MALKHCLYRRPTTILFLAAIVMVGFLGLYNYLLTGSSSSGSVHSQLSIVLSSRQLEVIPSKEIMIDSEALRLSEHPDIQVRGKFQKAQMKNLCQSYVFPGEQSFPADPNELYSHLLFSDEQKVLFCYVPKVGCTNMKRLIFYMSGNLPVNTVNKSMVDHGKLLYPAQLKASLKNETLTKEQKEERISNYYKFMTVRNPLERLLSAFRDKIEYPLLSFGIPEKGFPENHKFAILSKERPDELKKWREARKTNNISVTFLAKNVSVTFPAKNTSVTFPAKNTSVTFPAKPYNISVTFPEFCRFMIRAKFENLNEHFKPSMDLCHPCLIQYDFYLNFRNYSTDSAQLIKKFKTNPKFYQNRSFHKPSDETKLLLKKYYQQLNMEDRKKVFEKFYDELLFYYTLYPSERNSHQELLGIDTPILTLS